MENDDWVTGNIKLKIFGEPVEMQLTVPAKPVKARAMLPIFQKMTNSFVEIGENNVEAEGKAISCEKGCGACCRQAVPLAENETYHIRDLVENLSEPRRSEVKQKFADACAKLHEIQWFERMENYGNLEIKERQTVVVEYFKQGIPCPFLEEESCSIHLDRPLACREYLVTSPAENCAAPTAETIRMIEIPVKVSENVRLLGRSENRTTLSFIPMIRALEFAEEFPESDFEKPGQEWMGEFFGYLTKGSEGDK